MVIEFVGLTQPFLTSNQSVESARRRGQLKIYKHNDPLRDIFIINVLIKKEERWKLERPISTHFEMATHLNFKTRF